MAVNLGPQKQGLSLMELNESALQERLLNAVDQHEIVLKAIQLATEVHQEAVRDEGTPYIRHPLRVALILVEELGIRDPELISAALLHDVLEEGPDLNHEVLSQQFGLHVAQLVESLTDEFKKTNLPRAERKKLYLQRIAGESDQCLIVKLCDRLDNLRSLPYSSDAGKKEYMTRETRTYLMPLATGKTGVFAVAARLLGEELKGETTMFNPKDSNSVLDTLSRFRDLQPSYEQLCSYLQEKLREIAHSLGIYPVIMSRTKSLESFAEKIQRPGKHYDDPLAEMTDLCGVRVVTHTLDEVDILAEAVKKEFVLDPINSEDKQEKLAFREFGYLSKHFIIQLKEIPQINGPSDDMFSSLTNLKAELQIRTLAQHIWAGIYHELGYKNEFQLPGRWEREFARLAALLENCDKAFQEIKDAMGSYESSYGAYMTPEQVTDLANRLEILLQVDRDNMKVMHRLIRAYLALEGNDEKIKSFLGKYREQLESYAPALRDIGVAYCQIHRPDSPEFTEGQALLLRAIDGDPRDIDTHCSLGGTYRRQGKQKEAEGKKDEARDYYGQARDRYRQAHYLELINPYPLGNYIAEELSLERDTKIIDYFRTSIIRSMDLCRKQVEVKVNLPWALFDLGLFHLYLGDLHTSLALYAKGIAVASRAWMIRSANGTIRRFLDNSLPLDGLTTLDKLLKLGWWVKAPAEDKQKPDWSPTPGPVTFRDSVLVLAGGCGGLDNIYQDQLDLLRDRLEGFRGTIISGGTRSGIAKIPGDLQEKVDNTELQTIGYLPRVPVSATNDQPDSRYSSLRYTDGKDFSILEALTFWEEFLAVGGNPKNVRLIGFNGGKIAACEYRIALAFGAQVGIVQGSGRAADELLQEYRRDSKGTPERSHGSLFVLNPASEDFKQFLGASEKGLIL